MASAAYQDWGVSVPHGVGARFFESCDSTNQLAADYARSGEQGPVWLIAGAQTAGRGRRGRTWLSEPGNLFCSLLFRPDLQPSDLVALPYIAALSVMDTFVSLGAPEQHVRCKWPNDVLLNGKKASGILIESSARSADELDYIVIGIGMNLVFAPEPADAAFPATSLKKAYGIEADVRDAVTFLAEHLYRRLNAWSIPDISSIVDEWTGSAWGLGETRRIRTHGEEFDGVPSRLAYDGGLVVILGDGTEKRLYAGDIFPVTCATE